MTPSLISFVPMESTFLWICPGIPPAIAFSPLRKPAADSGNLPRLREHHRNDRHRLPIHRCAGRSARRHRSFERGELCRLPACAWCYHPAEDAPDVQPRGTGPITFGSFNAFAKINSDLVAIWAEVLNRVPESRLLMKSAGADAASSRQRLTGQFAERGVAPERIEMLGKIADPRGHLELYRRVDIGLDTFPYHGTTTTCEALWMGIPVVTLAGQTHVSRVGISLMSCIGLPELICAPPTNTHQSPKASRKIFRDWPKLRRTMRSRMQASPLMDAPRFARNVEAAYRQMWRKWCEAV